MKIKTIDLNGKVTDETFYPSDGTSLQGQVDASYAEIVSVFGNDITNDGYKVDAEWTINTPDGIARVYNYKDGKNYLGEFGLDVEEIRDWHIGGAKKDVVQWVLLALKK